MLSPFDLHVLGTPPAFILSQDQTLMLKSLKLFKKPSCQMSGFPVLFSGLLSLGFVLWNSFRSALPLSWSGIFRVALLFICQGSVLFKCFRISLLLLSDNFDILPHLFFVVNTFLKLFSFSFAALVANQMLSFVRQRSISYHSFLYFVNNFFKIFFAVSIKDRSQWELVYCTRISRKCQ